MESLHADARKRYEKKIINSLDPDPFCDTCLKTLGEPLDVMPASLKHVA